MSARRVMQSVKMLMIKTKILSLFELLDDETVHPKDKLDYLNQAKDIIRHASINEFEELLSIDDKRITLLRNQE